MTVLGCVLCWRPAESEKSHLCKEHRKAVEKEGERRKDLFEYMIGRIRDLQKKVDLLEDKERTRSAKEGRPARP